MSEQTEAQGRAGARTARAETLFRRYWFPLSRRCRLILDSASAGDEVARLCLARLLVDQPDLDPQADWLEALFKESSAQCIARLSDRSFRDGAWLKTLEQAARDRDQAESDGAGEEPAVSPVPDPHAAPAVRARLGPLLPRMGARSRQLAIHHFLDRLSPDELLRLTGIAPATRQKRLARLYEAAGDELAPLRDFDPAACPSQLALDRLLAGETTDLAQAQAQLEADPACAERQRARALEQEQALTAEAVATGVEALETALSRVGRAERRLSTRLNSPRVWVPAILAAVGIGLLLLMLWPSPVERPRTEIDAAGGFYLQVLAVEGEEGLRPYKPGEVISLGTTITFRAGADRPIFITLARVGETGLVEAITSDGITGWPLAAQAVIDLPFAYTLGPAGRFERVFAMYCGSPKQLGALPHMLDYAYQGGPDGRRDLRREWIGTPEGCYLRSVLLTRRMEPTAAPVGQE